MDPPSCSFYEEIEDEPNPVQKALGNYRWSEGLINSSTFGMKIESWEQYRSEISSTRILKLAKKNVCRGVFNEFEKWQKSLKVQENANHLNLTIQLKKNLRRDLNSLKVSLEKKDFAKMEEEIKTYWKLTIGWARDRFLRSEEEYLVRWFGSDLKLRCEWVIIHGSMPKFTTEEIKKRFEHFIKPLRILDRYGYRKKRIYLHCGTRTIQFILGSGLCESNEEALIRKKSYKREKKMRQALGAIDHITEQDGNEEDNEVEDTQIEEPNAHGLGNANEPSASSLDFQKQQTTKTGEQPKTPSKRMKHKQTKKEKEYMNILKQGEVPESIPDFSVLDHKAFIEAQFERNINNSEAHPLLLTALSDFKNVISNPEDYNVKTNKVNAESVEFVRPVGTGSSAIDAFMVGFEAKFDLNQILNSACDFSDDFSYSSSIFEQHIKSGSGLKQRVGAPGEECPYFIDLSDPETFAVFQSEFVDTAAKFFAQRNPPNKNAKGKK